MSDIRLLNVLQGPHVTEKTSQSNDSYRHYAFRVLPDANKFEIRTAVEKLFHVKVRSVRTSGMPGKAKRVGQTQGRPKSWKKAYVVLQPNQEIDIEKI